MVKAFYCVGTHWDREWYEPFQEYRMWLVELIDELSALVAKDPEYKRQRTIHDESLCTQ
jgi:alpha-mannosidase